MNPAGAAALAAAAQAMTTAHTAQTESAANPAGSDTVIKDLSLTFTTIDVPGAMYTGAWGINSAGDIVGNYGQDVDADSHGFLLHNGTFTYFDYPAEIVTVPTAINDYGLIVGYAGQNPVVGFLYDGNAFTTLKDGTATATYSFGINDSNVVVGGAGTIYGTKGFEMRSGQYRTLPVREESVYIVGSGINSLGVAVGWTDTSGFVCRPGKCWTTSCPSAVQTQNTSINDRNIVVGWCIAGPPYAAHAFVLQNGRYRLFDYPGAAATAASGVNATGQIVGEYTFDFRIYHGFVTNPITEADFR